MKFFNLNFLLILVLISCSKIENNQSSFKTKKPKKSIVVGEAKYDGPEKYMYYHAAVKHGDIDVNKPSRFNSYKPDYKRIELEKALRKLNNKYSRSSGNPNPTFSTYAKDNAIFIERGPYNAPGRTRALLVDASDSSKDTWIAGSVGGGVWKSSDGGTSWVSISNDMDNIAISWLGQSKSNTNILYAATGENWIGTLGDITGAGVYRSINGGANWTNISIKDNAGYVDSRFSNVSRLIVDPNDSDIVVISTVGSGGISFIFKTVDGGTSWTKVSESSARIQQIIAAPSDFNIQYGVQRGVGVIRSIDAGSSWANPGGIGLGGTVSYDSDGGIIGGGGGGAFGRLELAVSHQDPNIVFAGIDGDAASYLRVSYDGGTTWNLLKNADNSDDDWLFPQGWFDNTLTVNPFNDSIVYYAGRDASKATILSDAGTTFSGSTTKVTLDNTTSHMNLVNIWGGSALGSGTEWEDNSDNPDLVDIEVRFGPGKRQKAYRFSVPEGSTSNVAHDKYNYEGVVEVPFEVWNISTSPEQQLTVSFRDNANDGDFNLLAAQGESREYIFPQSIPYDPDMNQSEIIGDGSAGNINSVYGQLHKSLFLIWPFLADDVTWDPQNIPESKIKIEFIDATYKTLKKSVEYMTNQYDNGGAFDINENVHVDHHNLGTIIDSEVDRTFRIYLTTDGGIYYTISDKDPGAEDDHFKRAGLISDIMFAPAGGYNTTQFYGADKIAGFDQYIAGAQDNGTFYSPRNQDASDTTNYFHPIGGDGFEVIAHFTDPDKMFGGYQGNSLYYTHNGGSSWSYIGGLLTGSGPFINRASTSYQDPDILYTISSSGVDKSSDFGVSWDHTQIGGTWGNSFWSGADVEVSLANPRFVYAGGVMDNSADIFISKDWGATFDPVSKFANLGTITGLYSHPNEDSTAYILFGIAGEAKIIETKNLGESWNDLSGFHLNVSGKSSNGFPDVAVYSFLVMPHDSNIMWAGTEIGLFESTNRGGSWHKVVGNLPNVTIWDMKIKDEGQVVFATHGRGIWTATLDDLKTFVPKPTTLAPNLLEGNQTDNDEKYEIIAKVELRSIYDSLEIKANSVLRSTYYDTDSVVIKEYTFEVDDKGDFSLQAFAYKDGVMYPSNIIEIAVNPILDARTQFKTTFSDLVGDEFYLDRFRIGVQGGFEGRQLHTEHPYESGVDGGYTDGYSVHAMLNIPIIVTDFTPSIKFQEIVIVEPGEPGTSYGDAQFWDYVIVEASKDGITWKALLDGYDSNSDPTWKSAYATNQFGNPDLLRSKEANFKPHFNEGDTVKVRFRMFSDDLTVGWGWMVDDLYIQIETPVVQGIEFTKLDKNISVYPNPTNGIVNIKFNDTWRGDVNFKITDIFGRSITERILDNKNASSSHSIDISNSNDGVYIIQLLQGDKKTMHKVIKE
jgi:hypothetical protein